jgi:hypothetical protein
VHALALAAAVALAQLPPQNQPVNITQVKGSAISNTNPVPITCVSGCGGGSGGGAVNQGAPAQIDGGWPVILVDQNGNQLGTVSFPLQVAGGGSGGGGASWDAGVIVQFPVAIASLWDGGVVVQNFPAVQAVSQSGVWVIDFDPDGGVNVSSLPPVTQGTTPWLVGQDSFPWITQIDPDGGPIAVACVSGCGGGSGGGGASWDAGVLVQNFPSSFGASQVGDWSFLLVYDGGPLPVTVVGGSGTGWDAGVLVQNFPEEPDSGAILVYVIDPGSGGGSSAAWDAGVVVQNFPASFGASQTGNWSVLIEYDGGPLPVAVSNFPSTQTITGTLQVLQDSFPWQTLAPPDWDAGVEVLNFPNSFGASQTGNWSVLMEYDGGALPIAGIVTADQGTVPWQVSQDGAWTALLYYDGGPLPVSGAVTVSGTVSVSNFPATQAVTQSGSWTVSATQGTTPWAISGPVTLWDGGVFIENVEPDSGVPWVYVVNPSGGSSGGGGTVTQGPASSTPDSGWWVNTAAVINGGTSNVLCGNSDTALGSFAGSRKSIEICNQNPVNAIYICTNHPGCSSPNSIDAGTVVGEALAPGTCLSKATSLPMVCVSTSGTAQVSPDAGTVVVEVL